MEKPKVPAADRPIVHAAFHEVMHNTPKIVKKTTRKEGAEAGHAQEIAIALSKARAAGAHIPSKQEGGPIPKTGVYKLHKGETVVPAGVIKPKVSGMAYGTPGEESPRFGLRIKGQPSKPHDRMSMNPFEEEGFAHLRSHVTEMHTGGKVPATGPYKLQAGEHVVPKGKAMQMKIKVKGSAAKIAPAVAAMASGAHKPLMQTEDYKPVAGFVSSKGHADGPQNGQGHWEQDWHDTNTLSNVPVKGVPNTTKFCSECV